MDKGNRTTPSYVAFTNAERLIGEAAKNQVARNPYNTVYDAKRLLGRPYDDPLTQQDIKNFTFAVTQDSKNKPSINVEFLNEKKKLCT